MYYIEPPDKALRIAPPTSDWKSLFDITYEGTPMYCRNTWSAFQVLLVAS